MVLHNHKLPQSPFVGRGLCQCAPVRGTMPSAAEAGAVAHRHRDAPSPAQLRPVAAGGSLRVARRPMWRIAWTEWHGKLDPSQRSGVRKGSGAGAGFFRTAARTRWHAHRSAEDLMPAWEAGVSCKLLSWPNRWLARPFGRWHHRLALGGRGSDTGRRCSARLRPPAIPPSPSELAATGFTTSAEAPFAPSTCKT